MTFEEAKNLITYMEDHPYIILRKIQISCHIWQSSFNKMIDFINDHIDDEAGSSFTTTLNEEEKSALQTGLLFLPGVMLMETEDKAWEIYTAIVLLAQNYAEMVQDAEIMNITEALGLLIQSKNSWKALMTQCESILLQNQSMINASEVPYNLSRRFLTSLLGTEE